MDAFEFPHAGEKTEITDNIAINELPKMVGAGRQRRADLGTKVQKWLQRQTDQGLNLGGDQMAEKYLTEHKHPSSKQGIEEVHTAVGAPQHAIVTEPPKPVTRVPRATNPTTRKGSLKRQAADSFPDSFYLRHKENGRHGKGYRLYPGPNGWDDHDALGVQVKWDEDPMTWGPEDNPDTEDAQYRTDKHPFNNVGYTHYDRKMYPLKDFHVIGTLPGNLDPDTKQDPFDPRLNPFDPREFGASRREKLGSRIAKFIDSPHGGYHTRDDDDPEHVFTNPRNGEKYMVQHEDGTVFKPGDIIGDEDQQDEFRGIAKYPEGPSGGKLTVNDDYGPAYYPSNYNAEIVPYTRDWDPDDNPGPNDPRIKGASWGEWEPPKTASFFTRKVPGWRWDDHLNGYLSKEARTFTCSCGDKVASPSYKTCKCGKIWNVYAIGDTHHLASDTADMYIAREIPVRDNVIMANRKLAVRHEKDADGEWREVPDHHIPDVRGYENQFGEIEHEPKEEKHRESRKTAKDGDCTCWEGYERVPGTEPCASKSCRKKTSAARAQATFKQYLAEIERLADWTKYDDEDPAKALGKSKPPSTTVRQPPKDWAKRLPKGDVSRKGGTWTPPPIVPKSK